MNDPNGSIAHLKHVLSETFGALLIPLGFQHVAPVVWMRSDKMPIREIVTCTSMKGGCFSPKWGFGLDFCPVIKSDRVADKRAQSLSSIDLTYDPVDYEEPSPCSRWDVSYTWLGHYDQRAEAERLATLTVRSAGEFFAAVRSIHDLPCAFEAKKARPFVRFGWDNYVFEPLAFAFTLAKLGRVADAEREYAEWSHRHAQAFHSVALAKTRLRIDRLISESAASGSRH